MLFGLGTFGCYMYLATNFDVITLAEGKNWLLILPLLFIISALEIFSELKWGAKNVTKFSFKSVYKIIIWSRLKFINKKMSKQRELSKRQIKFLKKHKKEE